MRERKVLCVCVCVCERVCACVREKRGERDRGSTQSPCTDVIHSEIAQSVEREREHEKRERQRTKSKKKKRRSERHLQGG